jgi:hypothetical protein
MSDNHATPRPTPQPLCAVFAPLLPLLRSGELAEQERAQVEAHLADCAWCQHQLTTFDIVDAALVRRYGPAFNETAGAAQLDVSYRPGTRRDLTLEDIMKADQQPTRATTGQQSPPPTRPQTFRTPRRIAVIGASAAVLLVAILAARLFALHSAPGQTGPSSSSSPAATIPAGQGWTHAGPPWAQWMALAPSAPGVAYLCGVPGSSDPARPAPVSLALSQDAGGSWQSWTTALLAGGCEVAINPTNAQDLLLETWTCVSRASTPCPSQLYRSLDGGHNWSLAAFPPAPAGSSAGPVVEEYSWAWQGSTLFVSPSPAGTQSQTLIAVSVAEGPFAWVNERSLFAGLPAGSQIYTLSANTLGVYVDFIVGPSTTPILTKVSADQGATWSDFQPQYQGQQVQLVDQVAPWSAVNLADGHTLLGEVVSGSNPNTGRYVTSSDGGATWKPLAPPPGSLLITELVSTPSGVYYAELTSHDGAATAAPGVYRLAPGKSTWTLVGALPLSIPSGGPLAVSWNAQGQPLALWSVAVNLSANSSGPASLAGLVTHTP